MAAATVLLPRAPPTVIGPPNTEIIRPTKIIPKDLIDSARVDKKATFNANDHLRYQPPAKVITMSELGLEGAGISPNAVSEPFPLFNEEAVRQMRAEIFDSSVLEDCQYASKFASNIIRGFGPSRAPFIHAAWRDSEVLRIVSEIAGIELVPVCDYEIGHVNISFGDKTETVRSSNRVEDNEDMSAFAWHYDSYPFVCVTMLSDCEGMVGGETAIHTGTGEIRKVRGPAMGTAVVMQGRYLEHQALKAYGGRERISMVTSFRPRSALVRDETVLTGVRPVSHKAEVYRQYTSYRLDILAERIREQQKRFQEDKHACREIDVDETKRFLNEQKAFLESMLTEIV